MAGLNRIFEKKYWLYQFSNTHMGTCKDVPLSSGTELVKLDVLLTELIT